MMSYLRCRFNNNTLLTLTGLAPAASGPLLRCRQRNLAATGARGRFANAFIRPIAKIGNCALNGKQQRRHLVLLHVWPPWRRNKKSVPAGTGRGQRCQQDPRYREAEKLQSGYVGDDLAHELQRNCPRSFLTGALTGEALSAGVRHVLDILSVSEL